MFLKRTRLKYIQQWTSRMSYTHKEKKAKGEIIATHELVKLSAEYEKLWDDVE